MSSTVSPAPKLDNDGSLPPFTSGFESRVKGVRAECDGGQPIVGTRFAGRQDFAGTLTGNYRDFGPFPWRWYLMAELTKKPEGYLLDAVWCDAGNLTIVDEDKVSIPLEP